MSERFGELKVVAHSEIDRLKWNQMAALAQFPYFMHTDYLDACWPKWDALVLGDYEAALPLKIKKKLIWNTALHPLFIRSLEVIGDTTKASVFIHWLQENVDYFKLCFDESYPNFENEVRLFQLLSLKNDYADIRKNYSENVKRKLKSFENSGLQVTEGNNMEGLVQLFKAEKADVYEQMNEKALLHLSQLMNLYISNGKGKLLEVRKQDQLLAAAFFITEEKKCLYLKGIVNAEGKKIGGMQALFDTIIQAGANKWEYLDFGGSNDEGLAAFNRKFGSNDSKYVLLKQNKLPWPFNWLADRK